MVVMAEEGRGGAASWGDLNYYLGRRLSLAISSADDPILYLAGALPKNLSQAKIRFSRCSNEKQGSTPIFE
jgi:hypothetical protein